MAEAAIQQLVNIGKPAVPQLIEAFKKNRALLTISAGETLSKIAKKDPSVAQILIDKLGDKNPQIRFGAMITLDDNSFETALIKATQDKNPRIRSGAILALDLDGDKASVLPILEKALQDKNSSIRRSAAISLASADE